MLSTDFWKKYFRVYDLLNVLIPYQELLERIVFELDLKENLITLDAGSGTGNLSKVISNKNAIPVGIDSSSVGNSIFKEKLPNSEVILGDVSTELPFSNNYFDRICCNNVIYTIPKEKRNKIFHEFYRVLKPNGIIVVSNIAVGFSPIKIYFDHLKKDAKKNGIIKSLIKVIKLLLPTIRIFFYNWKIQREHRFGTYDLITPNEQKNLLLEAGFKNVSDDILVYANQAILNKAQKL
jgi:ubiquinone/menaquinone biosynthesis C-methylase UbiE